MIGQNAESPLKKACAAFAMVAMLAGSVVFAGPASAGNIDAQSQKQGKADKGDKGKGNDKDAKVVVVDRDGHHRVVREYVTRGNLPPGLAKRRTLPPGLSKQLREKGTLPPGLRDYYTPVPAEWNPRFPAIPNYYERHFVGSHLIIVDTRDNTLVSLIRDLLD